MKNALCIEYEHFLHAFRLVHPQRFSHTIHAFSDEYICIYQREKKLTDPVSGLSVCRRVTRLLEVKSIFAAIKHHRTILLQKCSLDIMQNHAEGTREVENLCDISQ